MTALAFSPAGDRLASAGPDFSVKLWDVLQGRLLANLKAHTQPINGLAFSTDGRWLAAGGEGRRVLVDANFRQDARRLAFVQASRRWGVPALVFLCQVDPHVAQQRLQARRQDVSDADWTVYEQLAKEWDAPGPATQPPAGLAEFAPA